MSVTEPRSEAVGFRNQLRARWGALPERQRAAIAIAGEFLLAALLFFIDHSLGYAVVVISALYSTNIRYDQGFQLGLIAFTAAVLGGIGNLPGAVLGAI